MLKLDNEFTADEAHARFPELLDRAAHGEEIRITQSGLPIACLKPFSFQQRSTDAERDEAFRIMKEVADRNTLGGIKIKDLIDEGRR